MAEWNAAGQDRADVRGSIVELRGARGAVECFVLSDEATRDPAEPLTWTEVEVCSEHPVPELGSAVVAHLVRTSGPDGRVGSAVDGPMMRIVQLDVVHRVDPIFPLEMRSRGDGRCMASVALDPEGVPTVVEVDGCADGFHAAVVDCLMQWRWVPPGVVARVKVGVYFRLPRTPVPRPAPAPVP